MNAFDDMQMRAVHEFVVAKRRAMAQADGVDHQRVAFPMPARMAVEGGIEMRRMAAAIGENAANLHVSLLNYRNAAGREQKFDIVGLKHNGGHSGREAVGALRRWRLVLGFVSEIDFELGFGLRSQHRSFLL